MNNRNNGQQDYYEQLFLASVAEQIDKEPTRLRELAHKSHCFTFPRITAAQNLYDPIKVSIGPRHRRKAHLEDIQEHKWRFLKKFRELHNIQPVQLYRRIATMESQIRDFYPETLDCNRAELVEMMILDGCFIVYQMCIAESIGGLQNANEVLVVLKDIEGNVMKDFMLFDNQIPFVVVKSIYEMLQPNLDQAQLDFTGIALKFFSRAIQFNNQVVHPQPETLHLLALIRSWLIINLPQNQVEIQEPQNQVEMQEVLLQLVPQNQVEIQEDLLQLGPSFTQLAEHGIQSKVTKNASSLLDIRFTPGTLFRRAVLEIPFIRMDDCLATLLINCMKYEQHCIVTNHVTSYLFFLKCLVNTPSDVSYMTSHGMLEKYQGNDAQFYDFFHHTGENVPFTIQDSYLKGVFIEMNRYSRKYLHVLVAGFKYFYFGSPVVSTSAAAAFFLILIALGQFV